jgi:catechol-2,3-dioxygenase
MVATPQHGKAGHSTVTLAVTDLDRSERFYREMFGFVRDSDCGFCDDAVTLTSPVLANGFQTLVLARHPSTPASHGLLLDLESPAELIDRHILARLMNVKSSEVLTRGRHLFTTLTDPDGHPIELRACRDMHGVTEVWPGYADPVAHARWARGDAPGHADRDAPSDSQPESVDLRA